MTMYSDRNYKTKKALKEGIKAGDIVGIHSPGLGTPPLDGKAFISGPWYPAPHTWYAEVTLVSGVIIKVK